MKKFFEKYDLIKLSGILILTTVVLSWVIKQGSFQYGEMSVNEISRVGFTSFAQNIMLGLYYFTVLVTFLFVLGGFYQVLSKTAGYQALIKGISKKLKGHEVLFVGIVSLLFAAWSCLANEYFPILVFIPFVVTILNRLKVDKIAAFSATFGAILVGIIGSVYSSKVAGVFTGTFVDSYIAVKIILFALSYILLTVFTIIRIKKSKNTTEDYDLFEIESIRSEKKNPIMWPYIVGLVLVLLSTICAYLPWSTWNVDMFSKATSWVNELSVAGVPIVSYIFGDFEAFGTWSIFSIQFVLIFATLLIHWFGKVSLDDVIGSFGEGMKKVSKMVVILLIVYAILIFALFYPTIPTIIDWIAKRSSDFNVVLAAINAFISSIFGVEPAYAMSLGGSYYASMYSANVDILAIVFQSMFGLASFFVPSSVVLMLGLSYLGISYRDWMKHIWKFLLAMLIVIIAIIAIMSLFVL